MVLYARVASAIVNTEESEWGFAKMRDQPVAQFVSVPHTIVLRIWYRNARCAILLLI